MQQLQKYLDATRQKDESLNSRYTRFGEQVGVSLFCVRKWLYGQRRISDPMKIKIEKVTGGEVTIEDLVRG